MNSINFHNAIVSLLKGVLDEDDPDAKCVPAALVRESIPVSSQTGGAPAIEAVDEMFKGGNETIMTSNNDRYIDEDEIEIDDPADIQTGGAFDDKESSSEEEAKQPLEEEINGAEPVDSEDGTLDGKVEVAKDGDGDIIENEDNIDEGTDDGERAGDEDNKEKDKKKIQIPKEAKEPL